jgi:Fic family protein
MKPFKPNLLPLSEIDWESHVQLISRANRALASYNGTLYGIPNPTVLLAPLATREAVLSSKIEGTQASFDDVLKFEAGEPVKGAERETDIQEILNYRRALNVAEKELKAKPLHLNLLLRLHEILLNSVRGRDKARGRFRTDQNWIGPEGCTIDEASFVPPDPMDLQDLLNNWEKYYHAEERDPLVQLAVVHAQFEIIHPFLDGNGRMGRILIPLFLCEKGVLGGPGFYLSEYLEANRDLYVERLRQLGTPGSWDRWINFFLTATEAQAKTNEAKARKIVDLYVRLKQKVLDLTHSQFAVPMLDLIFKRPVFRSSDIGNGVGMPTGPMVWHMLKKLREAGVLKVVREGKAGRPWVLALAELINLCEGKDVI